LAKIYIFVQKIPIFAPQKKCRKIGKNRGKQFKTEFRIIFGHDAKRRLQKGPNYLGLDTGLVYGNHLSALIRFPDGEENLITVDAKKPYEKVNGPILP